ncbi:MAG: PEP-CTERM sorting domain-containing protein [Verrucomicrobia bacterium]|nr:PEP-CTERM sorting domain-containing protein [Verrucomicrobiota bacterium]
MKTLSSKAAAAGLCTALALLGVAPATILVAAPTTTQTFTNSSGLTIQDEAANGEATNAVSQTLNVSGIGSITNITFTFTNFTTPNPDDLDFLLVAPNGTTNFEFMSDAGGTVSQNAANSVTGLTIVISDAGASALSDNGPLTSGTFQPGDYTPFSPETGASWGGGATGLTINHAQSTGTATFASVFTGVNASGTWTLYAADDLREGDGSVSTIGSWSLTITGAPVPEPGTWAMLTAGGVALLPLLRRRHRRNRQMA